MRQVLQRNLHIPNRLIVRQIICNLYARDEKQHRQKNSHVPDGFVSSIRTSKRKIPSQGKHAKSPNNHYQKEQVHSKNLSRLVDKYKKQTLWSVFHLLYLLNRALYSLIALSGESLVAISRQSTTFFNTDLSSSASLSLNSPTIKLSVIAS